MDKARLLKSIKYKFERGTKDLHGFIDRYNCIANRKLLGGFDFHTTPEAWNIGEARAEVELRTYDQIQNLQKELKTYNRELRYAIHRLLPKDHPTARELLEADNEYTSVATVNEKLPIWYHEVVTLLNRLNQIIQNLKPVMVYIEKIDLPDKPISKVWYDVDKKYLLIGKRKTPIGDRGKVLPVIAETFFGDKRNNLLKRNIEYSELRENYKDRYPDEVRTKKQFQDDCIYFNKKVRHIVPNGEDLIITIEDGFAINRNIVK